MNKSRGNNRRSRCPEDSSNTCRDKDSTSLESRIHQIDPNANLKYKGIYSDVRETYTKRLIGITTDYIVEYDAENHLAFAHNSSSPGYYRLLVI